MMTFMARLLYSSVQFSLLTDRVFEGNRGGFSRDPLPVFFFFSAGGPCEQFWHWQICPFFDVVHPAFPLLTTASPTLQGALKDGFGMSCSVSCSNHASLRLLTVARRGSCGLTRKLTLLCIQSSHTCYAYCQGFLSCLLISTLPVHSPAFFPKPLPIFPCVGCD